MPKVELDLELEQLAKVIRELSPGELETLEILLNNELRREVSNRWREAKVEMRRKETLSKEELFSELNNV